MKIEVPECLIRQINELNEAMNENPNSAFISVEKASKLLGVDKECLRASILNGNCRFGFGGSKTEYADKYFYKIPKLSLYNFLMPGVLTGQV